MSQFLKLGNPFIKIAIFVFLFQASFSFYQIPNTTSAEGYTSVVCTLVGTKEIFVPFDSDTPVDNCIECPACIIVSHEDNGLALTNYPFLSPHFLVTASLEQQPVSLFTNQLFSSYLSRAPPV